LAAQDPTALVQQALQQQQQLVLVSRQQFQGEVGRLNELMEAQAKGFAQTRSQAVVLLKELEQHVRQEPRIKGHFENLLQGMKSWNPKDPLGSFLGNPWDAIHDCHPFGSG